jgi:hypothetical protein
MVEVTLDTHLDVTETQAALLATHEQLIEEAGKALPRIKAAGDYRRAIALLAGHAMMSAQALQMLCVVGRANQGRPTGRAIIEALINAYYISRDPAARASRFWDYLPIPLARAAEARFHVFGITDELDAIRKHGADAKARLSPLKHWAGRVDVRSRAVECGLGDLYDLYYPEASAFSHGDSSVWHALSSDDGARITLSPSADGIEDVLQPAISAGFGMLFLVADVFDDTVLRGELGKLGGSLPQATKRLDLRTQFAHIRSKRTGGEGAT